MKGNKMLISVVIPAYNSEKYIGGTIKSILDQTFQDFEIIVINDGSTDNTENIVKSINDSRIKYIYKTNSGPGATRNIGLEQAKGEYIAFLDADDEWEPEKLEIQLEAYKKNPDVSMIFSAIENKFENSKEIEVKRYKNYSQEDLIKNLLINPLQTVPYPSTVLIKKSYLDEVGYFDVTIYTGQDWDLWLRLVKKANFLYIDKVLTRRFKPKSSLTSSVNLDETEKCHLRIIENFLSRPENKKHIKLKEEAIASRYFNLAMGYFYRSGKKSSEKVYDYLFKCLKHCPLFMSNLTRIKFVARVILNSIIQQFES